MNELATSLGVTNGALTSHVKKLEESGIVKVLAEHGGHGNQKICRVNVDKILIDIVNDELEDDKNIYTTEVPVGHYSDYEVYPTCGIATNSALIGEVDGQDILHIQTELMLRYYGLPRDILSILFLIYFQVRRRLNKLPCLWRLVPRHRE